MSKRYIFISIVFIALSLGLVLLPKQNKGDGQKPETMLLEINSVDRYLSTDKIAERIILGDPKVLLLDVRSADQYDEYHIPGAYSLPLSEVLNDSLNWILSQKNRDIVFYSNSSLTADQAWILSRRNKVENLYVMKGGLNEWFSNIMLPTPPAETEGDDAIALYEFRLGASAFFGMPAPIADYKEPVKAKPIAVQPKIASPPKEVIELKKVVEEEDGEGC